MGVTGIGTVQTYRYNFKTGKLSAKDGSENEFISFFNEGHSGGSSKTLNGFDWQVRGGIRFLIEDEFKLAKISGNDLPAWYDPNIEDDEKSNRRKAKLFFSASIRDAVFLLLDSPDKFVVDGNTFFLTLAAAPHTWRFVNRNPVN